MNESEDAAWLRQQILENNEFVIRYDGNWIAVYQREVLGSEADIGYLIKRFSGMMKVGKSPLFFFCYSGAFQ